MANINNNSNNDDEKSPKTVEALREHDLGVAVLKSDHDSLGVWETAKKFKKVCFDMTSLSSTFQVTD